ncbi:hypothetical protein TWF696_009585 [Orbilia brochopaga]|uniref:Non-homologous end-joining factor 1 n=1 Tax=Orbilia brochopaga TaxID=3140254 RepID=A0AAV9UEJ3_9PEZI
MAPTTIAAWEPFPVESPSAPALYLQRHFTDSSYTIYLTDLSSIWSESLEKSSICDRAEDRNCSIDPSTDDSQLHILLEKLHSGITGLNPAVTVDLEVRGDTIIINTKEKLQAPLQPLEWRFRLKLQSSAEFTKRFSMPLLYYSSLLSRQTNSLLTVIEEKDTAVTRLLDKFEEYKVDISSIFPGYKKGRAPTGRAKGIAKFDKDEWRQEILGAAPDASASKELIKTTFRQLSTKDSQLEIDLPKPPASQWWTKLSGKVSVKGEPEVEPTPHTTPRKPPKPVRLNTDSDDDFEALRSSPSRPRIVGLPPIKDESHEKPAVDDETTDDEDDLDAAAPKSQNSRTLSNKSSQLTPPAVRLASPRRSATGSASPNLVKRELSENPRFESNFGNHIGLITSLVHHDSTTSESEDEAPRRPKQPSPKASKIKKTVGGRNRQQDPPETTMADAGDGESGRGPQPEPEPEPPKRLGKIKGTIGGRKPGSEPLKRKEPEPDSDEEMVNAEQEAPKPPPKKKEKTKSPPIEGMDEEAAQKRRDELRKQLAAKAAGKKRVRKF